MTNTDYDEEIYSVFREHSLHNIKIVPASNIYNMHRDEVIWVLRELWKGNLNLFKQNNISYGVKPDEIDWTIRVQSWQYLLALFKIFKERGIFSDIVSVNSFKEGRKINVTSTPRLSD